MKKSRLLAGLLLAGLTLVGCAGSKTTIKTILETAKKNDEIKVEGVVYAVANNGYYISDGEEKIFVDDKTEVAVGNKVTLEGVFGVTNNKPYVKNLTKVKVKEGGEAITAKAATIAEIAEYDATAKTGVYGSYVCITGTIAQSASGAYQISDDHGKAIYFADNSNDGYKTMVDLRVDIEVVVAEKNDQLGWTVAYCGGKLEQNDLTHAQLFEMAKEHIDAKVAKTVYGKLKVPTKHNLFGDKITYQWSSANEELVKFNYVEGALDSITVAYDLAADTDVQLTCAVSAAGETSNYTFTVKVKAIVEQSVKSLLENIPEVDGSAVIVTGTVIGYSNNQSGSLYGVIIQDPTDPVYTTQVDCNKAQQESAKIGQTVRVFGYYRSIASGDRPTIYKGDADELMDFTVTGEPGAVQYVPYFTVDSEEDMVELTSHWSDKYCGRLIKFENAKAVWNCEASKKTGTSYVIITYNTESTTYKLNGKQDADNKFCLIYQNNNRYLGSTYWADNMGIAWSGETPTDYAATFYAVPSYFTSGTIAMLSIPSAECWIANEEAVNVNAKIAAQVATEVEAGETVALPATVTVGEKTYNLTWTSANTEALSNEGVAGFVQETVNVEMTATYKVGEEDKTFTCTIAVLGARTYTVHELFADAADAIKVKVQGVVVGYRQDASYSTAGAKRVGYVLMDLASGEIIYCINAYAVGGNIYEGFKDSDGTAIKLGDFVEVVGLYHYDSNNSSGTSPDHKLDVGCHHIDLIEGTTKILEHNKTVSVDNAIVVDSEDDLAALVATNIQYNKLIKIVATAENPIYFRTHGSTWTKPESGGTPSTGNNISFTYDSSKTASGAKFDTTNGGTSKSLPFSICAQGSQLVWELAGNEDTWYSHVGYEGTEGSKAVKCATGVFYVNISLTNNSYYHCTLVLPELCTLTPVVSA